VRKMNDSECSGRVKLTIETSYNLQRNKIDMRMHSTGEKVSITGSQPEKVTVEISHRVPPLYLPT
jgi:hypothetical protein